MIRLLLVDDEPSVAALVDRYLVRRYPGEYFVLHASDLRAAKDYLLGDKFEVILLDLGLPDARGTDTVAKVRAMDSSSPIIILSHTDDEKLELACIERGAQDFILKSEVTSRSLRRAVGFALSRRRIRRIRELELALDRYRQLSTLGSAAPITSVLSGLGSVRERQVEVFEDMRTIYEDIIREYMSGLGRSEVSPRLKMRQLIAELGRVGGGPRDLLDLHTVALTDAVEGGSAVRAHTYTIESRLLALELMGQLVEYYRLGALAPMPPKEN